MDAEFKARAVDAGISPERLAELEGHAESFKKKMLDLITSYPRGDHELTVVLGGGALYQAVVLLSVATGGTTDAKRLAAAARTLGEMAVALTRK